MNTASLLRRCCRSSTSRIWPTQSNINGVPPADSVTRLSARAVATFACNGHAHNDICRRLLVTTANNHKSLHPAAAAALASSPIHLAAGQSQYYSSTAIQLDKEISNTTNNKFAVVDHSEAYETAMNGRHGQQISLARLEGLGKDDPPFDPFLEDELQQLRSAAAENEDEDGIQEAEIVFEEDDGEEDDDAEYDEKEEELSPYNPDGSIRRTKSALATLRAGFPSGGVFAVVELAGAQHKVTTDDLIVVNKLKPVDIFKVGSVHTLTDVMLVGSSHLTIVGMPYVNGAEVDVMVEEITQDAKVIVFKKRRRKNSQRKNGYRRDLTLLRVLDVRLPEEFKDHDHVGRESVDELDAGKTVFQS